MVCGLLCVNVEGDHTAEAGGLGEADLIARMLGKTDVEHIQHLRLCLQKRRNLHRVVLDPVHADSERLDAANEHEGIKRSEITADRLVNQAELFREVLPVRRGADKPGERVIVALQIFCPAVDDEVRTE